MHKHFRAILPGFTGSKRLTRLVVLPVLFWLNLQYLQRHAKAHTFTELHQLDNVAAFIALSAPPGRAILTWSIRPHMKAIPAGSTQWAAPPVFAAMGCCNL